MRFERAIIIPLGTGPLVAMVVGLTIGCGRGDEGPLTTQGSPVDPFANGTTAVVARVGDDLIRVADLQRYLATHGGSPRDALHALEDQVLLLQEARRRGWESATGGSAASAEEQLLAQRVLVDLERAHPMDAPSDSDVEVYLSEHLAEIVRDQQRDAIQVLVELPQPGTDAQDGLARAYAEATLERMRQEGVEAVWSSQPPEHEGLRVKSQYLPTSTTSTEMPDDFRRVIFGLTSPGPGSEPIRTPLGWHVVAVTEIHPPIAADSPEALRVARERLVTTRRREALTTLLRTLAQRSPVRVESAPLEVILPILGGPSGSGT